MRVRREWSPEQRQTGLQTGELLTVAFMSA